MGRGRLRVHPTPRVVLLSVGDELVEPGAHADRSGHGVFETDGHALEAAVRDAGAASVRVGILGDDRAVLREAIEDQLVRADLLVITGGLSELTHDTVKDVLATMGSVRLDQVAMTPGQRHGFGTVADDLASDKSVPIFALQGHPVAAQVSFEVFVRPALRAMAGHAEVFRPSVAAEAVEGWVSPPGLRQFVPGDRARVARRGLPRDTDRRPVGADGQRARARQRARGRRRAGPDRAPRTGDPLPGPGGLMASGWPAVLVEGDVRLRPLRRRDQDTWMALRAQNAAWLEPWDATSPVPVTGPRPSFGTFVRTLSAQARAGVTLPFAIDHAGRARRVS